MPSFERKREKDNFFFPSSSDLYLSSRVPKTFCLRTVYTVPCDHEFEEFSFSVGAANPAHFRKTPTITGYTPFRYPLEPGLI